MHIYPREIRKHKPGLLLIAGDIFDYRKTLRTYVRRYEGEGYTMEIRKLLQDFDKPIYAVRENHERDLENHVGNYFADFR